MQSSTVVFFFLHPAPLSGPFRHNDCVKTVSVVVLYERFGPVGGLGEVGLHSSEAVSHRRCLQNEMCRLGFWIGRPVTAPVSALTKGAAASCDHDGAAADRESAAAQMKCCNFFWGGGGGETFAPNFFLSFFFFGAC